MKWIEKQTNAEIKGYDLKVTVLLIYVADGDSNKIWDLDNRKWAGVHIKVEASNKPPPSHVKIGGDGLSQQNEQQNYQHQQNDQWIGQSNNGSGSYNNFLPLEVQNALVTGLRGAFQEPYKHLDMSRITKEQVLRTVPGIAEADEEKVWGEIFYLCKSQIWPKNQDRNFHVHSITLRENGIKNFRHIRSLGRIFPRLKNLDLGNNLIPDLNALQDLKGAFQQLEFLILDSNPVSSHQDLSATIRQWYPKSKDVKLTPPDGAGAGASMGQAAQGAPGLGIGIGQALFQPNPRVSNPPPAVLNLAPLREYHPEIPADSLFAMPTLDKPSRLLQVEIMGLRISRATGLNLVTTEELLKSNDWDEVRARQEFGRMFAAGQIPADRLIPDDDWGTGWRRSF